MSSFRSARGAVARPSLQHQGVLYSMARKPNYDFEKRRKEQDRKTKKDAKRAERQQRRDDRRGEEGSAPPESASDAGQPGAKPPTV